MEEENTSSDVNQQMSSSGNMTIAGQCPGTLYALDGRRPPTSIWGLLEQLWSYQGLVDYHRQKFVKNWLSLYTHYRGPVTECQVKLNYTDDCGALLQK